ncbi:MAG: putative MerR family transcriptional regulator [Acidimicrobiales bacterium]|nr:putative MerR family transcriptional regulator [Acidimicrobiales bacterium]
MAPDSHLSIGEVLSLLQAEFPDVTISKIRFLESQGLIDPERTPSGYRKFYEADIERLRWILTQQRENFLPLKVIKDRLADGSDPEADAEAGAALVAAGGTAPASPAASTTPASPTSPASPGSPSSPGSTAPEAAGRTAAQQPIWMADLARAQAEAPLTATYAEARPSIGLDSGPTEVSLTAGELVGASGISFDSLRELEQYGLIVGRTLGDDTYYDGDALLVATKAAGFIAHGIGARHLRMFKVAAEREAGFLEQVAMPLLKQRNPQARRQAVELVEELSALGHDLRAVLLRAKLRHHLDQA